MHWCAPEIIEKQIWNRFRRAQILVFFDGTYIIEYKATVQGIIVADHCGRDH